MNTLPKEKQLAVLSALVEGNSIRSTERMTGVHRDTIMRLLVEVGERCQAILDERMRGFHSRLIQADEIWTFCRKKQQRACEDEEQNNPELGDQYVFVALDAESKLIPRSSSASETPRPRIGSLMDCDSRPQRQRARSVDDGRVSGVLDGRGRDSSATMWTTRSS